MVFRFRRKWRRRSAVTITEPTYQEAAQSRRQRARVASITADTYAFGEEWIREVVNEEELPMPAGQLLRVLHALTEGLVFQRLLTPELLPDQVIRAALLALVAKRHESAVID